MRSYKVLTTGYTSYIMVQNIIYIKYFANSTQLVILLRNEASDEGMAIHNLTFSYLKHVKFKKNYNSSQEFIKIVTIL